MIENNEPSRERQSRFRIAVIVYIALLIDNILLTVIVPILPDYLAHINDKNIYTVPPQSVAYKNVDLNYVPGISTKHPIPGKSLINFTLGQDDETKLNSNDNDESVLIQSNRQSLQSENGSIGILLAMKAFVQLIFNPIVGNLSSKFGYRLPIVFGTFCLLLSSIVFSIGETYGTLLIARAVQGIGSACIGVCGMSLVAQLYPEEDKRSKVMGVILGSIALGVLLGYPFGGILYDFIGKAAPFIILSTLTFLTFGMQLLIMDLSVTPEVIIVETEKSKWTPLLKNNMILAIVVAILISTSAMAILEPCLPIWLLDHLKPKKWQLGTVFIPDSVGYFVGTNFFGTIAYNHGQVRVSCCSLLLVGLSCIWIPNATTVWQLLLPHFGLGLGIGVIDAALVPLLANFVDASLNDDETSGSDSMSSYGTVYAIQQTSVSLAYCLAPLLGGELAETIGFAWLMRIIGFLNIIYGPALISIFNQHNPKSRVGKGEQMSLTNSGETDAADYKRLYNAVE